MITAMLVFVVGTVLLLESVWGGHPAQSGSHRFDLMAGDEGED